MCTAALPGDGIRELRRFAHVILCHSDDVMGVDPETWSLSRLSRGSPVL